MKPEPIPEGYGTVTPWIATSDTARVIEFIKAAFDGKELGRVEGPVPGRIGHAEITIEGALVMLSDEYPECGIREPKALGGTPVTIHLHVDDADALIGRCVEAGATLERAPQDEFYGERSGVIRDPFGHRWNIGHSIEEMSAEEMQRRYTALMAG